MRDSICFRSTKYVNQDRPYNYKDDTTWKFIENYTRGSLPFNGAFNFIKKQITSIVEYKERVQKYNPSTNSFFTGKEFDKYDSVLNTKENTSIQKLDAMSRYLVQDNLQTRREFFEKIQMFGRPYVGYCMTNDNINFLEFLTRPVEERSRAVEQQLTEYIAKIVPLEAMHSGSERWDYTTVMQLINTFQTSITFDKMSSDFFRDVFDVEAQKKMAVFSIYTEALVMAARRSAKPPFYLSFSLLPPAMGERISRCYDYFRESCSIMQTLVIDNTEIHMKNHVDVLTIDVKCLTYTSRREFQLTYSFNENLQDVAFYAAMTFVYTTLLRTFMSVGFQSMHVLSQILFYLNAFDTEFDSNLKPHSIKLPSSSSSIPASAPLLDQAGRLSIGTPNVSYSQAPFLRPEKTQKERSTRREGAPKTETLMERKYRERQEHLADRARALYERESKRKNTVTITETDILSNLNARIENALSSKATAEPTEYIHFDYPECVICFAENPTVSISPCNHKCICVACHQQLRLELQACPVCRGGITSYEM
ncbi:MAG: RING-HC finger protein [Rhodothermaceae bacterium TMED105]|mgnify:CR=1 FL=1|nr:MAG: RING-HC finger protein [Rhodothermaceae bacterium TMED105]|tara:strand:+ start:1964 stop:3574 length:1611 start_codon:yes stop_codon:yes gene_type:complete